MEEKSNQGQTPHAESHTPPVEHHEEHHEHEQKSSSLKSKWPFLVIAVLLLLLGAFGAYSVMNQTKQSQTTAPTPTVETSNQTTSTPIPTTAEISATANWKLYTNTGSGYSIKYPGENYVRLICPGEELTLKTRTATDTKDEESMETCGRGGRFEIEVVSAASFTEPVTDEFVSVVKSEIVVADVTARKYISTKKPGAEGPIPDYSEDLYFENNGKKHLIHFGSSVSDDIKNKILSTFKFI